MIKHIEGTRPRGRVTRNTPVGSLVCDCFNFYPTFVTEHGTFDRHDYDSEYFIILTPGPLPWHHRAWSWLAERWGK
jgi:hypothetical protein